MRKWFADHIPNVAPSIYWRKMKGRWSATWTTQRKNNATRSEAADGEMEDNENIYLIFDWQNKQKREVMLWGT